MSFDASYKAQVSFDEPQLEFDEESLNIVDTTQQGISVYYNCALLFIVELLTFSSSRLIMPNLFNNSF